MHCLRYGLEQSTLVFNSRYRMRKPAAKESRHLTYPPPVQALGCDTPSLSSVPCHGSSAPHGLPRRSHPLLVYLFQQGAYAVLIRIRTGQKTYVQPRAYMLSAFNILPGAGKNHRKPAVQAASTGEALVIKIAVIAGMDHFKTVNIRLHRTLSIRRRGCSQKPPLFSAADKTLSPSIDQQLHSHFPPHKSGSG